MTDTPLIVRKVTADRGVKAVTTHEVLACIKEMTSDTFSTRELADALMTGIRKYFAHNPPLARSRSV